ncbi:nucleotidyl transferase AbiEii/AbiGii toxin family protein [Rathayibacter sp. VKM Ac-2927]|uniref:nucleotidyl transferase AbiEii/AbiGii toxin family protein n=1 Tax=Rathayibacter sp. VKM Ac-2927 TaxID=2929478 RepID=UPI001FB37AA3|nr:nucleotidyl transferase AbiEii/AbiGii toxin family protein [Rathayibacter sp. VKM Ac-2927]MCJ1689085.1 nucleotidyl transferase AbiEii/AbiGii toxin family protein [Rathayibacter sp. VKM Ac-2927]
MDGSGAMTAVPPLNVTQLNERLAQSASELGIPVARARVMLCTLIVSQMLPDSVAVKGGMGVKLRFGERGTRATSDFDVSTRDRGEEFERDFRSRLAEGWGAVPASRGEQRRDPDAPPRVAFTATVRAVRLHDPGLTRPEYVMHPYRVSIAFLGSSWGALDVEVSDPETEPDGHLPSKIDDELVRFGAAFGFGDLRPVRVVGLEYQIAQKLHAVTDPTCVRAHDLVDLQLLWEAGPDPALVLSLCVRTFGWRRRQPWPPLPLRSMDGWGSAYQDARAETEVGGRTPVVPTADAARTWLTRILEEVAGCGDTDG